MPVITRITAGKRNQARANIYVDGEFALALSIDEVVKRHLKKGVELTVTELNDLVRVDKEDKLYAKILNFLSFRPHSVREVRDRARHYLKDDSPEVVTALISRLTRGGYLDDRAFATWFVASRKEHRPRSRRQLASELAGKGIPREIVDEVLGTHADESAAIQAVIAKKRNLDDTHLMAYLARRGFSYETIRTALAENTKAR